MMTIAEAREYVAIFAEHTMPGARYVEFKDNSRIYFSNMNDDQALKVAASLLELEIEASKTEVKQ